MSACRKDTARLKRLIAALRYAPDGSPGGVLPPIALVHDHAGTATVLFSFPPADPIYAAGVVAGAWWAVAGESHATIGYLSAGRPCLPPGCRLPAWRAAQLLAAGRQVERDS
jgi:hypothetical protein